MEISPTPTPFIFSAYKTAKHGVLDIKAVNSLSVNYSSVYERKRGGEEKLEYPNGKSTLWRVLLFIGFVLAAWSYNNNQLMGQLFGGALVFIGIVSAALAYNKRKRFVGTHGSSPDALKPA